jgi:hypothetical protein
MDQILVFKKETTATFVYEASSPEDALWGVTRSFYLNKVLLGRDAKAPAAIKITVEVVADEEG